MVVRRSRRRATCWDAFCRVTMRIAVHALVVTSCLLRHESRDPKPVGDASLKEELMRSVRAFEILTLAIPFTLFACGGDRDREAEAPTNTATYDAGVLTLRRRDDLWAKLCFERSPQGEPMVVSVVTRGVSDDCNSFVVDGRSVWLRRNSRSRTCTPASWRWGGWMTPPSRRRSCGPAGTSPQVSSLRAPDFEVHGP